MKRKIYPLLILSFLALTGCSSITQKSEIKSESTTEYIYNEEEIKSKNLEHYSEISEKHKGDSDIMTIAIECDDNGNVLESADVKVVSAVYETGKIEQFEGFDEHWQVIYNYNKYFNEDGILKPEYVFAEVELEITSNKSWDELLLTNFTLQYISNDEAGSEELDIIDQCIDYTDLHKGTAISIEANTPKIVTLGYVVHKETFDTIMEAYIYGRFSTFNIMNNSDGALPIEFSKIK